MKRTTVSRLVISTSVVLAAYACGGDSAVIDGGPDGTSPPPDNYVPLVDSGNDGTTPTDADIDTGVDSGTNCTSTPCVVEIAVGNRHACVRIVDGTVSCWGRNSMGEVGTGLIDGGFDPSNRPSPVTVGGVSGITHVSASGSHPLPGNGFDYGHTCAMTGVGVQCWGANQYGQLGYGAGFATDASVIDNNPHPTPAQVQGLTGTIAHVSNGGFHGCAVNGAGTMSCWGDNQNLKLGRGSIGGPGGVYPVGVDGGVAVNAVQAGGGGYFTLALMTTGQVASWGDNNQNQLGRATGGGFDGVPRLISTLSNVTQVSAGYEFGCAVTSANALLCWGDNTAGQLGRGLTGGDSVTPTTPSLTGAVKQVATGEAHACAVMTDGTVYCWGNNQTGQTAVGSDGGAAPQTVNSPVLVGGLSGKALQVGCGGTFSCAVIEGGSVQCWGSNFWGQLGRGADSGVGGTQANPTPVTVTF